MKNEALSYHEAATVKKGPFKPQTWTPKSSYSLLHMKSHIHPQNFHSFHQQGEAYVQCKHYCIYIYDAP